jgi:hypothetical protein
MILPTKILPPSRSLLGTGATILRLLDEPKPVSRLWPEFKKASPAAPKATPISFGWFVLALDLLYLIGAVEMDRGRLSRASNAASPVQQ